MSASANRAAMNYFAAMTRSNGTLRQMRRNRLEARYDAAITNELNKKYWRNADRMSADAANSPEVRATLRSRARYECHESDSILKGVVHTLANDVIGTGPRLQMQTHNAMFNRAVETKFAEWARQTKLARKLRTMRIAKLVDGEAFAQMATNPRLRCAVKLDLILWEADRCASPHGRYLSNPRAVDGIQFDDFGNPEIFERLKYHPGGLFPGAFEVEQLPAEHVIHLFRQDRPEQHRGIPEITPALPLCALRRDYVLAVLHNARSAAKFTGVLETKAPVSGDEEYDSSVEPFDMVDIDYDMLTSLPAGWQLKQFVAAHPMATFEMFMRVLTIEIGRCILMPYGITAADSSRYNYSSGRLDHQAYFHSIDVERGDWELDCLDKIFFEWLDEALLIPGYLPPLGPVEIIPHCWFWDSRGHVDPQKEAAGVQIRIKTGVSHRALEYAAEGYDVDTEDERAARSFGVSVEEYRQSLFKATFSSGSPPADQQEEKQEQDEEQTLERDEEEDLIGV
ncbi:phage portal protein [Planctomicrobium sp. SH661]|uniref:phage portal protein n=1 Tax=Planctomicrobium sp. SH661 TaxID=3448124 RepID=UPI003F5BFE00